VNDYLSMPDQLPQKPEGWKQQFAAHFNFGGGKGASSYSITDETGRVMPITLVKSSSPKMPGGFGLPGVKESMTWAQLRALWPRWIEIARRKQRERAAVP
jgi:hypothetical protein